MSHLLDADVLPVPRPDRRVGPMGRTLARVVPGVGRIIAQIEPWAAEWDRRNEVTTEQLASSSPNSWWAALGDSTAQGIGASSPDGGWVGQLAASDRRPPLINLSVSGARTTDLIREQLPRLVALGEHFGAPSLVTIAIGANDIFRSPNLIRLRSDFDHIAEMVGPSGVMATLPQAPGSLIALVANRALRSAAATHEVRIAELSRHLQPPYRKRIAEDGFHPNELGYADWAAAFAEAID